MELRDALTQIAEIRLRMAETELFRGYRSLPVAMSGILAILAALLQPFLVNDPQRDALTYCILWVSVAVLSIVIAGLTMMLRDHFGGASLTREVTLLAISQLAPPLLVGGVATAVIVRDLPDAVALLPGLWQLLFSLGLFASCRLLPRATFGVALFYLASGTITLALAGGDWRLHPLTMGLPFGIGQFVAAGVLYWNLERTHEEN